MIVVEQTIHVWGKVGRGGCWKPTFVCRVNLMKLEKSSPAPPNHRQYFKHNKLYLNYFAYFKLLGLEIRNYKQLPKSNVNSLL